MVYRDNEVIADFDLLYNQAWMAWNAFYPLAEEDLRFYCGDQWEDAEKRALAIEGRRHLVFNRIKRVLNLITGYQRKNRLASVVAPMEGSDQEAADMYSQLLQYAYNRCDGYNTISDCFGGACKSGWNLASLRIDYTSDPINGDIVIDREPWNSFIIDPYFTKLDLSDCNFMMRRKYLSPEMVAALLPSHEKEIWELYKTGWDRDDKFTWLPYQRNAVGQELLAYSEFYRQEFRNQRVIIDRETSRWVDFDGSQDDFDRLKALQPSFELIKRSRKVIIQHIIVNDTLIETIENPLGVNEYPFVPFIAIWEPESDLWELKVQSVVRALKDPQREANIRRSQSIDIIESQINSGWIAEEGAVVNPNSLFQTSQGRVIWKHQGVGPDALVKIPPADIPPGMLQLQQLFDADIVEIAGVNDAAFGQIETANESGVMQMLRQGAAVTNLQDLFDNLRKSQKALSLKILKLIQQWSPEKIKRILNKEPPPEFYAFDMTKYDLVVQEGMLTETQRLQYFRQLIDLQQLGVPIPPNAFIKAAPVQGKTELMQEIQEFQKQQAEAASKAAEAEQAMLTANMELAKTKAIEQLAGAKERYTRAMANLGLEDERVSQSVENQAEAVLKKTQAATAIEGMQLDNAQKYLGLVEMLNQVEAVKGDVLKSDDESVADTADLKVEKNIEKPQEVSNGLLQEGLQQGPV